MSKDDKTTQPDAIHRPALRKPVARRDRRAKTSNVPGLVHGTRVAFHIECERCGVEATLPFVPKTDGALLCPECAQQTFGEDWHGGRVRGEPSAKERPCDACGDVFEYWPKPDMTPPNLCRACRRGDEKANPDRIGGAVLDPGAGVRKKRRGG